MCNTSLQVLQLHITTFKKCNVVHNTCHMLLDDAKLLIELHFCSMTFFGLTSFDNDFSHMVRKPHDQEKECIFTTLTESDYNAAFDAYLIDKSSQIATSLQVL